MKKGSFVFLLFLMSLGFFLSACGKKEDKKERSEEAVKEKSEEIAIEVPPVSIDGLLYGIVLSYEKDELVVQSDRGESLKFQLDKEVDVSGVGEEIAKGLALRIEYSGKIKNNSTKKVKVEKILSSDKLPKLSKEALAAAATVIIAFSDRDVKTLSTIVEYPLLLDRGKKQKVDGEKALFALNKDELFDRELVRQISGANLFMLEEYAQGFFLGKSVPNVIVSNTKKGWRLTAFHYK